LFQLLAWKFELVRTLPWKLLVRPPLLKLPPLDLPPPLIWPPLSFAATGAGESAAAPAMTAAAATVVRRCLIRIIQSLLACLMHTPVRKRTDGDGDCSAHATIALHIHVQDKKRRAHEAPVCCHEVKLFYQQRQILRPRRGLQTQPQRGPYE